MAGCMWLRPTLSILSDSVEPGVSPILNSRAGSSDQGLTLVHFSAERKRFLWDRECIEGLFRGCCASV